MKERSIICIGQTKGGGRAELQVLVVQGENQASALLIN